MERLVYVIAELLRAARRAYARLWTFLALFFFIFITTLYVLDMLDLLPSPLPPDLTSTVALSASSVQQGETARPQLPERIEIPSLKLSVPIENPFSTEVPILDAALLKGAVRYPTSAQLNEDGNVVIFGHSSYLPVVRNPAYKTFNGIQKLKPGETITVYSSHTVYVYSVKTVMKEKAETTAIPLKVTGRVLTLSTCDSFGEKSDRFVVVAEFVGSQPIANS